MTNPTDPFDGVPTIAYRCRSNICLVTGKDLWHRQDCPVCMSNSDSLASKPAMRRAVVKWMRKKAYDMVEGEKPPVVRGRGLSARNQASVCYQLADQLERGKK